MNKGAAWYRLDDARKAQLRKPRPWRDYRYDWGTNKTRINLRGLRLDRCLLPRIAAGRGSCQSMRFFDNRLQAFYGHWSKK
jgi:hypothetical protein